MTWRLALIIVIASASLPPASARGASALAPLPATVRVNVAALGTSYAKIGSTGTISVTNPDSGVVYAGAAATVTRLGVRRLADPTRTIASAPDDVGSSADARRALAQLRREARLVARIEGVQIITIPFEFSIETPDSDPLAPPLLSAQKLVPLRFSSGNGVLTFNGKAFRGTLELAADDEGDMIVVNTVDTSSYLASVVGSEIPPSWEPEALAAQAIAARTYLATHLGRHKSYDLEGDTRDQQYDGIAGEARSTVAAVDRTAGVIATYAGAPIEALYSANAGGITEDSENVFPSALPYLRSVASPADSVAEASSWGHTSWQWTQEYSAPQLEAYLAARGVRVGALARIEATRVSPSGRVIGARIVGASGSRDLAKDTTRYYFGLRSTLWTVAVRPEETEIVNRGDVDRIRQVEFLGGTVERTLMIAIRDPDRARAPLITGWVYRLPARFVFSGKGFGHGVGLSQWGAQGMALGGASAAQILTHYYTGIDLTKVGGA